MIKWVKHNTSVIFAVMFFILGMFTCEKLSEDTQEGRTRKTIEHTSDTVHVHHRDTVTQYWTITKKEKPDTVVKYREPDQDHHLVQTRYDDDTLDLKVDTRLKGEYLDQDISYELDYPQQTITETDSTIIRDSVTITKDHYPPDPWQFEVGLNTVGGPNSFDFGPQIGVSRGNWGGGYGFNIIGEHHRIYLYRSFEL